MKTIITILIFLGILASLYYFGAQWAMSHEPVTRQEFVDNVYELKNKIDSLAQAEEAMAAKLDSLSKNVDTLKKGQQIIFDEVKKNAEKKFWQFF